MFVKDLQQFLSKFTEATRDGKRQGNAISEAKVYVEKNGFLEEIKRIEVHESPANSMNPLDSSMRVILKPQREEKLILPPGYVRDY